MGLRGLVRTRTVQCGTGTVRAGKDARMMVPEYGTIYSRKSYYIIGRRSRTFMAISQFRRFPM